jgi:GTPase SAR1 family protein
MQTELNLDHFSHFLYAIKELRSGLQSSKSSILLNGHSGSGKTTLVHLLLKEKRREVLEVNSSNYENLSHFKNKCKCFSSTITIENCFKSIEKIIFIDDLDVLITIDKNLLSFLVDFIKSRECSIICVYNHTVNKKPIDMKIEFSVNVYLKRLTYKQCFQIVVTNIPENVDIDYEKLAILIKENNNDLRTVMNHLNDIQVSSTSTDFKKKPKFLEMSVEEIIHEMCMNILSEQDLNEIITHDVNQIVCLIHENSHQWLKLSFQDQLQFMKSFNEIILQSEYIGKYIFEKYDFSIWDHYTFAKFKSINHLLFTYFQKTNKLHMNHSQLINKQSLALNFNKKMIKMEKDLHIHRYDCAFVFLYIFYLIHSKKDILSVLTKNEFEILTRYVSDFKPEYKQKILKLKNTILKQ